MFFFDEKKAQKEWFCQWNVGCILFALINSGMIDSKLFSWMNPNENMKTKTYEEKILFELHVMTVWAVITGYYPFKHKETFHTIYSSFMKLVKKEKEKLSPEIYNKKISHFKKKIKDLETLFSEHDDKYVNNGTWDAGRHLRLQVEDFTSVEDLEYKDLLCLYGMHWVVYLGKCKDEDSIMAIDSKNPDSFEKLDLSELNGSKVIHRLKIYIEYDYLHCLLSEFDNPIEMLKNLRRREFSKKIADLIVRLDAINFTEHDYNKFVAQSKTFLEKLDKEHHKYEL